MSSAYINIAEPLVEGYFTAYLWIVVCGGLAAFFMAWGIGANDVANSFATSVGSKTLKLWQAVIVAGIFEFAGSVGLGSETTKTIASDIANTAMFKEVPEIYMYGMLCSLAVAGSWLLLATFWRLPVSTTHSIIGSIMGFSLVYGGYDGVLWNQEKGDFPYSKGFLPVVLSWFFSPIISGILSTIIFLTNRICILRRKNSTIKAIWSLPALLFFTFFINIMFVLAKGAKKEMQKTWPCDPKGGPGMFGLYYEDCSDLNAASAWIAACVGAGVAIIGALVGIPLLKRDYAKGLITDATMRTQAAADAAEKATRDAELKAQGLDPEPPLEVVAEEAKKHNAAMALPTSPVLLDDEPKYKYIGRMVYYWCTIPFIAFYIQCKRGLFYDIFEGVGYSKKTEEMHANAEVFAPRTERVYQALQVLSACCVSFAHGSNDVANSIGPFSAIYTTYQTQKLPGSSTDTPFWIFILGGIGIVLGLLQYGYNIIMELGVNMLHLTPSRGFSAELATGLTVSLASFFGIPVSTTQIIVGAEVGVGLCEWGNGFGGGLDGWVLAKTFAGWIWTILLSLAFTAALFSAGAYAPSIIMSNTIITYRTELANMNLEILTALNKTNNLWVNDTQWWNGSVTSPMRWNGSRLYPGFLNKSINMWSTVKKQDAYIPESRVLWYTAQTNLVYKNYSMALIGQNGGSAAVMNQSQGWRQPQPKA